MRDWVCIYGMDMNKNPVYIQGMQRAYRKKRSLTVCQRQTVAKEGRGGRCLWDGCWRERKWGELQGGDGVLANRCLFVSCVDVGTNVFDDFGNVWVGLPHLLNAVDGVEYSGMVTVIKLSANFFQGHIAHISN